MRRELLRMENISKYIYQIPILKDVNLNVLEGEVVALMGANGAGKTTLMEILAGIVPKDEGTIFLQEEPVKILNPEDARRKGIQYVHNGGRYIGCLSVMENMFLGSEKRFLNDRKKQIVRAKELLAAVGLNLDPRRCYRGLGVARKRLIELAGALYSDPRLIIMDEPFEALMEHERLLIMEMINKLKRQKVSMVFITHNIREALEVSDRILVLRDGISMGMYETDQCSERLLLGLMAGEEAKEDTREARHFYEEVLRVERLCTDKLQNVSFCLRKGEILGLAGMVGAGKSQLMDAVYGITERDSGEIYVNGQKVHIKKPSDALKLQMAYVSESWKTNGLVEFLSVRENVSLPSLKKVSYEGVINTHMEETLARHYTGHIFKEVPDLEQPVRELSSGMKQKVRLSKWLGTAPDILFLDEPTLGVDVGSRKEIHRKIREFSDKGMSIVVASGELNEIIEVSDRILVMHEGRIKGELTREEATRSSVLSMIL